MQYRSRPEQLHFGEINEALAREFAPVPPPGGRLCKRRRPACPTVIAVRPYQMRFEDVPALAPAFGEPTPVDPDKAA